MNNKILNANNSETFSNKIDWKVIQEEMKKKLGSDIYDSWLKKIFFEEEHLNYILLSVTTRFIRDWITSRYLDQILQIVKSHNKEISRIEFIIKEKNNIEEKLNGYETKHVNLNNNISFIQDSYLKYNRIDPLKSFEQFIVGSSNKLAFEASKKVSRETGFYNPLYLYGGVGMGKTHLLNAIGLELKKTFKVMLISAERFMYQFVRSIKSNEMFKFKEYFRNTDVLLIDDIQFMTGKEAMQEEFFHTFNALLDKGSQIIISADRAPNRLLRIQERIKSRFSGGLVIDIQKPDQELRYKIIKKRIEDLNINQFNDCKINEDVQKYISSEVKSNVRELLGALNRIISFTRIYNKTPGIAETKIILKDILNHSENKVTVEAIQSASCKYFKINKNEMLSSRRSRYLVRPRQVAIYLTKMLTSKSLPEIGRDFANRDHTTVIHSVKTIEKLKEKDSDISISIDNIKNEVLYKQNNEI
tara:strand:- start:30 stop:1448 length:1419 start_codon:yes stop_codon:yes gene_type:complete